MAVGVTTEQLKKLQKHYTLTDKELKAFQRVFMDYDLDRNGALTRSEILNALDFLSLRVSRERFQDIYRRVELNAAKQVEEYEFLKLDREESARREKKGSLAAKGTEALGNMLSKLIESSKPTERQGPVAPSYFASRMVQPYTDEIIQNKTPNKRLSVVNSQAPGDGRIAEVSTELLDIDLKDVQAEDSDYHYFDEEEDLLLLDLLNPDVRISNSSLHKADGEVDAVVIDEETLKEQKRLYSEYNRRKADALTVDATGGRKKSSATDLRKARRNTERNIERNKTGKNNMEKDDADAERKRKKKVPPVLADPKVRKQLSKQVVHKLVVNGGIESFSVNPLGGPKVQVLLQLGGKYVPCMKRNTTIPDNALVLCPGEYTGRARANTTSKQPLCHYYALLGETCALGGFAKPTQPDQWFRFVTPLFLHSGVVHLLMNALMLWRTGMPMEEQMGTPRMLLLYLLSGVGGNLFSSLMLQGNVTVGASSAIYGLYGMLYLDLFENWPLLIAPWREFLLLSVQVLGALAIGLLPGVDNFAHIGGFLTGLCAGALLMPKIYYSRLDKVRKRTLMVLAVPTLIGLFVYGFVSFYSNSSADAICAWCHYLDCVPADSDNCRAERGA